jgi:hypothetical protein
MIEITTISSINVKPFARLAILLLRQLNKQQAGQKRRQLLAMSASWRNLLNLDNYLDAVKRTVYQVVSEE